MVVRPQALQRTSISGRTLYSELETAFLLSLLLNKCLRYTYLPMRIPLENAFFHHHMKFRICKTTERVQVGLEPSSFTCLNPSIIRSLPPSQVTRTDLLPCPTLPYPTRPFIHPSPVPYSYYSRNLQIIILLLFPFLLFLLGKTLASPACRRLFSFSFFGYVFILFANDEIDPYLIENRTERKNRTRYPRTTD